MNARWIKVCLLCLACFLISTTTCYALTFPQAEDEAAFLKWYETNKDKGTASYQLRGDLSFTKGTPNKPIVLDGNANITIACDNHLIVILSSVIINNPNLTIKSTNGTVLLLTSSDSDLTLQQGSIFLENYNGLSTAIGFMTGNGKLTTPKGSDRFSITAKGSQVSGLHYNGLESMTLTNLDITVYGTQSARGIDVFERDITVENCTIAVDGELDVYGVYGDRDVHIAKSSIHATSNSENAQVFSAFGAKGTQSDSSSVLSPSLSGSNQSLYFIKSQAYEKPYTVPASTLNKIEDLPKSINVYVREQSSEEEIIVTLPVVWNTTGLSLSKQGTYMIQGNFVLNDLDTTYMNTDCVTPQLSIICTPKQYTFLVGWDKLSNDKLHLLLPFPYDANYIDMQYSYDGNKFINYTLYDQTNLFPIQPYLESGLLSLVLSVPLTSDIIYIRFNIAGGSYYDGVSPIWKLDLSAGQGNMPPEYKHGNGDGDRGGQEVDLPNDENKHEGKKEDNVMTVNEPDVIPTLEYVSPYEAIQTQKQLIQTNSIMNETTMNEDHKIHYDVTTPKPAIKDVNHGIKKNSPSRFIPIIVVLFIGMAGFYVHKASISKGKKFQNHS